MGQKLSSFWDQSFFIAPPTFTDEHLPDQTGKVHFITGGYAGIGCHLARLLYAKNATLYLVGRSEAKAKASIAQLKSDFPNSNGRLNFLYLDLADLATIKPAVEEFLSKEDTLDVLVNNAAIMVPPEGSKSVQGYDLQTATNVYGPFLLTILLRDAIVKAAKKADTGSVRIVWAASHAADLFGPPGGVHFVPDPAQDGDLGEKLKIKEDFAGGPSYAQTKAADIMLGVECARRWGDEGIISTSLNPGNIRSELVRDRTWFEKFVAEWIINHPTKMGAWTELFAGWSQEITPQLNGCYIIPWGRIGEYNDGLKQAITDGKAKQLWEVCEGIVQKYM
ncbi:Nn.00g017640.m01.CDS01 [Neocucurbitaria sp. VM-36]